MSWYLLFAVTWMYDARDTRAIAAVADEPNATVIVIGAAESFDWTAPFRPEPFWMLGAIWAERLIPNTVMAYGRDVPELARAIEDRLHERGLDRVGRMEFWCHGDSGYFRIRNKRYRAEAFLKPGERLASAWNTLRKRLAPVAVLHFRSCATLHSEPGHDFAVAASRFFNAAGQHVTIVGYTRPTGLTHPGGHALPPGALPHWSVCEGDFERDLADQWVGGRDVLRIISGGGYDMIPAFSERVVPLLRSWMSAADGVVRGRAWSESP